MAVCKSVRNCVKITKTSTYNKYLSKSVGCHYKKPVEIGVRAFVRLLILNNMMEKEEFSTYNKIVEFVKATTPKQVNISVSSISKIKSRLNSTHILANSVPRLPEVTSFFEYVEKHVPNFKGEELLVKLND